ncbi:TPA: Ger(x)C family spore germination protein [Bacillus thuringiensis]|uniref:Ger(X)C family germination protein n=1 Tax=Bacillus cereus TIAC219 TaxID=718222 RepID=A0ABC9SPJ9_BACCE|nr:MULTISPECIES: Ger(x)C family spore germination protein [Bacillus]EJP81939.1 Ger(X)C family germination protein [Bacillus cereus VD022]EOQ56874.1 Ger(X)C family germination protein [Bacillus cereus TIAC219]MED3100742.1 Ger(x)C family spore germination protein [Bacillus thuringiensis]OTY42013.1 spore gernimation protein GerC [Bacillus thuringiensis serovar poloniensis]RUR58375.1 Ger(x)C family spore germination protein [Bacillus sp. VKPM B-3276]
MKKKIFFLLISIIFLTGCWSRRELNKIAINLAVGIDKVGDEYLVSCQVVNPNEVASQKGGTGRAPVTLFQGKGDNISEAMRRITVMSPRKIYWAHIQMLIIDEKVAREGINKILDVFLRNSEVRSDFYIAISKNEKAQNILKVLTPLEKIPANQIFSFLEVSHKFWAPTVTVTIDELVSKLMSKGTHPVITGITVIGKIKTGEKLENVQSIYPSTNLKLTENAVFKKDKLVGWLNLKQSKGYNFLTDNVNNTIVFIKCNTNKKIFIEVRRSKTKVTGKFRDKQPIIDIAVLMKTNIAEIQCNNVNLTDPKVIHQLEKSSEKRVKKYMREALHTAQKKYKIDIFGFGEYIHRANPKYWHQVKNRWDKEFVNLPVNIKVKVQIEHSGISKNSFLDKVEK